MFFYTLLFVASFMVALVILWLLNTFVETVRVVYCAFLPSSKDSPTSHLKEPSLATTINDTPTPWGWPGNNNEIRDHGPESNGTGLDSYTNNLDAKQKEKKANKPSVGWPYREDRIEFAGKAYKVTRKVTPKKTNLKTTIKPWGW